MLVNKSPDNVHKAYMSSSLVPKLLHRTAHGNLATRVIWRLVIMAEAAEKYAPGNGIEFIAGIVGLMSSSTKMRATNTQLHSLTQ